MIPCDTYMITLLTSVITSSDRGLPPQPGRVVCNSVSLIWVLNVKQRCDGITVDHDLEVSLLSKVARIQFGVSRRSNCRKMTVDNSVVIEMVAENLFYRTGDVWRRTILHKHRSFITSPCLKSRNSGLLFRMTAGITKRIVDL
ncbi:hypothetical protein TNCV_3497001 [Trichonephila clavipes]|nr:hypothetical protein TNCV_3497001 [Trichonephila clavipes]